MNCPDPRSEYLREMGLKIAGQRASLDQLHAQIRDTNKALGREWPDEHEADFEQWEQQ